MSFTLTSIDDLADLSFDQIIDVRSPAEFAQDHIPGALNLPALSNEERAHVGRIYVQDDPFKARKIGAALVARNVAHHLETTLSDRTGGWKPLVYCWRGGQRSGSFCTILAQIGWRAQTLDGGYQSYRKLVTHALYETPIAPEIILLDGGTGTAKTALLAALHTQGAQVIDLEGLAAHRGSVFGPMGAAQPSQKAFESRLAEKLANMDAKRPVYVEAESSKIGKLILPPTVWKAMITARQIVLSAPLHARARHIVAHYPDMVESPDKLLITLEKMTKYHGRAQVENWAKLAGEGAFETLAADLITRHYDPRYARVSRRAGPSAAEIHLADLSAATLAQTATQISAKFG